MASSARVSGLSVLMTMLRYSSSNCWYNYPVSGDFPVKKCMVEVFSNPLVDLPVFLKK